MCSSRTRTHAHVRYRPRELTRSQSHPCRTIHQAPNWHLPVVELWPHTHTLQCWWCEVFPPGDLSSRPYVGDITAVLVCVPSVIQGTIWCHMVCFPPPLQPHTACVHVLVSSLSITKGRQRIRAELTPNFSFVSDSQTHWLWTFPGNSELSDVNQGFDHLRMWFRPLLESDISVIYPGDCHDTGCWHHPMVVCTEHAYVRV